LRILYYCHVNSSGGPTDVNVTPTDATCGQDNGSLSIGNVTGGDAPYAYSINGGTYSNTTNYTNLAAGTYTIGVRDANGCVFSTTASIISSGGPTNVNVTPTDAACGQDNGSITIDNVTGGMLLMFIPSMEATTATPLIILTSLPALTP
jgi:hypothetical protein